MVCSYCGRAIRRSPVTGWLHVDGSYWCFPKDGCSAYHEQTEPRASDIGPFGVICCSASRTKFGY